MARKPGQGDERDKAHAHQYRLLQAQQLLAAHSSGHLQDLMDELERWRGMYPDTFRVEVLALQQAFQNSSIALKELERKQRGKEVKED
jgi:hypothetical protein